MKYAIEIKKGYYQILHHDGAQWSTSVGFGRVYTGSGKFDDVYAVAREQGLICSHADDATIITAEQARTL